MMRKLVTLVITGCATYIGWLYFGQGIGPLSSSDARAVKAGIEQKIYNQGGSLQEPIAVQAEVDGKLICGWYERKGILQGRVAFTGLLFKRDGKFTVAATAESDSELRTIRDVCAARGLII